MINPVAKKQIEQIKERCNEIKPLVVVRSLTFNHAQYLKDALEGFVKQKTDFPFVVIVHDDASTDGTSDILLEYAEKYPDIIFPIFEDENQWSKHDGSLGEIIREAQKITEAKYLAFCEGDDYWVDPLKLQKQVDFMEANPDYSMCATNALFLYPDGQEKPSPYNTNENRTLTIEEIILEGGMFLTTATLLIRFTEYKKMPKERFHVGDYPLQIYMAYLGKVELLKDISAVYRVQAVGSWSSRLAKKKKDIKSIKEHIEKEFFLLDTMNRLTEFQYSKIFKRRKAKFSYDFFQKNSKFELLKIIVIYFPYLLEEYSIKKFLKDILPNFISRSYSFLKFK